MATEAKPTAAWKVVVAWIVEMIPLPHGIDYFLHDSFKMLESK